LLQGFTQWRATDAEARSLLDLREDGSWSELAGLDLLKECRIRAITCSGALDYGAHTASVYINSLRGAPRAAAPPRAYTPQVRARCSAFRRVRLGLVVRTPRRRAAEKRSVPR